MYAHGFRFYFTPLTGVLFAFPSRYWFTIGQSGVFSLGGWSPHIQTRFHVPRPTRHHYVCPFVYGNITLYVRTSQSVPLEHTQLNGLFPFRSPLLRESQLISFPKGTEMFHFPSFALHDYVFIMQYLSYDKWVSPFRHLRITGYLLLPEAYRSLSRLSSALSAKASTIRSYQHNQTIVVHGNELLSTHV